MKTQTNLPEPCNKLPDLYLDRETLVVWLVVDNGHGIIPLNRHGDEERTVYDHDEIVAKSTIVPFDGEITLKNGVSDE